MNRWLIPFEDLTQEQKAAVKLSCLGNQLILGPIGSGKTQILIHRTGYLAKMMNAKSNRYRVFVFNNTTKEFIKSGLKLIGIPKQTVSTFDHFCRLFYERYINTHLPYYQGWPDFELIRKSVLDLLKRRKDLQKQLDFVLVDEGQDLSYDAYTILKLISKHITVLMDPSQKIFKKGIEKEQLLEILNIKTSGFYLKQVIRSSPFIVKLASYFCTINNCDRQMLLRESKLQSSITEKPSYFVADNYEEELDAIATVIKERMLNNERIGILLTTNASIKAMHQALLKRSIKAEPIIASYSAVYDFNSEKPNLLTYFSAKGLTYDTIIMPQLTSKAFEWMDRFMVKQLLFVGIGRATKWVFLSSTRQDKLKEFDILIKAEANKDLMKLNKRFRLKQNNGNNNENGLYDLPL
ncbi:UvrD-helicase domain-containing protein [Hippea jasoniae]|uniref:UvrD-helicase domain-containing protein n=1 Tax=Hippea jasoniae TaxID=944479 RepID=UPI0005538BC1|nr:UvrD-helicase domain-containing protein [Hippea jasoniae]